MPDAGPLRIIEATSGGHYCEECHSDITGGEFSTDSDRSMYVHRRLLEGICGCCGTVIDNGEYAGNTPLTAQPQAARLAP